jgi:hypothetical protein
VDDEEGGQPGGNIRVAYLFDPARVSVDEAQVERLVGPAFARKAPPAMAWDSSLCLPTLPSEDTVPVAGDRWPFRSLQRR